MVELGEDGRGSEATPEGSGEGEYIAPRAGLALAVASLLVPLIIPVTVTGGFAWVAEFRSPIAAALAFLAAVVALLAMSHLRRIRWDEDSISFTWWAGNTRRCRWEELADTASRRPWWREEPGRVVLLTKSGELIRVPMAGRNYAGFRKAVAYHLISPGAPHGVCDDRDA